VSRRRCRVRPQSRAFHLLPLCSALPPGTEGIGAAFADSFRGYERGSRPSVLRHVVDGDGRHPIRAGPHGNNRSLPRGLQRQEADPSERRIRLAEIGPTHAAKFAPLRGLFPFRRGEGRESKDERSCGCRMANELLIPPPHLIPSARAQNGEAKPRAANLRERSSQRRASAAILLRFPSQRNIYLASA